MSYPWPLLLALAASFSFFFSFQTLFSTFPLFLRELGGGAAMMGATQFSFAMAAILSRPLAGWVSDRMGRRPGLILGSAIFTTSMVLYCFVRDLRALLFLRAFHGTGIAFFTTAFTAFVSDIAPPERRGEIIGLAGIPAPLSLLIAPLAGDLLAMGSNFPRLFLASAGFGALSLALTLLLPETLKGSGDAEAPFSASAIAIPVLLTGAAGVSYGAIISFLPVFLAERNLGPAGLFFSLLSLVFLPSLFFGGKLSDSAGRGRVVIPATALAALSMASLAFIRSRPLLAFSAIAYGLGYGTLRPAVDAMIVDRVLPLARGKALGFNYAGFDLGVGAGSLLLGLLAQNCGYGSVYAVSALILAVAGTIFLREGLRC